MIEGYTSEAKLGSEGRAPCGALLLRSVMVDIAPFCGWRYNPEKVPDLEEVVAPPYDVIEPAEQRFFHQHHPWNVVRLDFGQELPSDNAEENRYSRAAVYLRQWRKEKILLREERPSIYVYRQTFAGPEGGVLVRTGFIALVRLEPFGSGRVFPHEETFAKHRTDRLRLLRATHAHFNPIFSIFQDPHGEVQAASIVRGRSPIISLVDRNGVEHTMWAVDEPDLVRGLVRAMKDKPVFIADGHHRYETCLSYWEEKRGSVPGRGIQDPFQWTMMYLTRMEDQGLVIFPTHKMVAGLTGLDQTALLRRLREDFLCSEFPFPRPFDEAGYVRTFLKAMLDEGRKGCAIGIALHGLDSSWILTPRDPEELARGFQHVPGCLRSLGVTFLHEVIFRRILGIDVSDPKDKHLSYLHDATGAFRRVWAGEVQITFIMNPTKIEELRAVATARCKMPHKATYFYPKLLSGLVMNIMEEQDRTRQS